MASHSTRGQVLSMDLVASASIVVLLIGGIMAAVSFSSARMAQADSQRALALDAFLGPTPEIVMLGDREEENAAALLKDLRRRFIPNRVVACRRSSRVSGGSSALDALFDGREPEEESPTVFVCQNFACKAPVSGRSPIMEVWRSLESDPQP